MLKRPFNIPREQAENLPAKFTSHKHFVPAILHHFPPMKDLSDPFTFFHPKCCTSGSCAFRLEVRHLSRAETERGLAEKSLSKLLCGKRDISITVSRRGERKVFKTYDREDAATGALASGGADAAEGLGAGRDGVGYCNWLARYSGE